MPPESSSLPRENHSSTPIKTDGTDECSSPSKLTTNNKTNVCTVAFALTSYLYFFVIFLAYWAFLVPNEFLPSWLNKIVPYSMDTPSPSHSKASAIIIDISLLAAFAVPHSILARLSVKKKMNLPQSIERSFFVLQASLLMHLQIHFWQDFDDGSVLWDVSHNQAASTAILLFFLSGFLFLLSASFALDHFHLFGLSQSTGVDLNEKVGLASPRNDNNGLVARWHYKIVAHPIMTGMLIGCWATPTLTIPRLLFAAFNTVYIMGAVTCLEEPTLKVEIGPAYGEYLETVPRFVPGAPTRQTCKSSSKCPFSRFHARQESSGEETSIAET